MKRFIEYTVLRAFVTAWRLAESPTSLSPLFVNATTEGVVRLPSEFSRTTGSRPSIMAIQELVVPKSMPSTFAISRTVGHQQHRCQAVHLGPNMLIISH